MSEKSPKADKTGSFIGIGVTIAFLAGVLIFLLYPAPIDSYKKQAELFTVDGVLDTDQADVASKVPGRLMELKVEEGDTVKEGQLLAMLDTDEILAKKKQAQAGLEAAKVLLEQGEIALNLEKEKTGSQIEQAQAGVAMAQAGLEMARARLEALENGARSQEKEQAVQALIAAKAAYETSEKTHKRIKALADDGVVAEQKADEAELAYRSAKAGYEAAKARQSLVFEGSRKEEIRAARQQVLEFTSRLQAAQSALRLANAGYEMVDIRKSDIAAAEQKIEASQGALDEVNAYLKQTKIISPMDGSVTMIVSHKGEMIAPGYTILSLARTDSYWVDVYVDETKWSHHKVGDTVQVEIPALGKSVEGKIIKVIAAADFATKRANNELGSFDIRSIQARISIHPSVKDLAKGMTARVNFGGKGEN